MKNLLLILISLFSIHSIKAQELNAKVVINSSRIEGTNREVFTSLQSALNEFLNSRKWSAANLSSTEKIDCSFSIVILTNPSDNFYQAEISVNATRPVYNSTYATNLITFRDTDFEFDYMENTPILYVENSIDNNLIATIAFYAYLVLGIDFDSFAPNGGSYFFRQAQNIAMRAQSYSTWTGWTPFAKANNRTGIITSLMDESLSAYHNLWYTYHRKGLDEMAANPDRGRTNIINALSALKEIKDTRSSSALIQMFADSKLDEIVLICSKASSEEKKEMYELLSNIYPTMTDRLEPLKK